MGIAKLDPMIKITTQQKFLVEKLDNWVKSIEEKGGGEVEMLEDATDYMSTFKELMDVSSTEQFQALQDVYLGFYRFAKLIELVATGLRDGVIPTPPLY